MILLYYVDFIELSVENGIEAVVMSGIDPWFSS